VRLRDENGQAVVITTLFIVVLLGAMALAIDVGSWFRESRQAQATADAAALSAAEALPAATTDTAYALATQYGADNGGGIDANSVTFQSRVLTNDTVKVNVSRTAPGFFSVLFGIDSTTVRATATARAGVPTQARYVAPIVVNKNHPLLAGPGCPCFNIVTTLPLGKTGAPGAFALVNLDNSITGTVGASTVASWIQNGYSGYLPLGDYFSDPGAKWNDGPIQAAVNARKGTDLLFPVYDTLDGTGSNAEYHVIAWAGFHIQSEDVSGSSGSITGYFTRLLWDGIEGTNGSPPNYGVYTVSLVN
jgi:Flp pilus assembly protein TadG